MELLGLWFGAVCCVPKDTHHNGLRELSCKGPGCRKFEKVTTFDATWTAYASLLASSDGSCAAKCVLLLFDLICTAAGGRRCGVFGEGWVGSRRNDGND